MTTTIVDPRITKSATGATYEHSVEDTPAPVSSLARLQASINRKVKPVVTDVDLPVDYRDGWEFRYTLLHPYQDVMQVSATAQDDSMPSGINYETLGIALGVELCRGLLIDGEEVLDETGQPLTFASKSLQRELGASNATECLRKAYAKPVEDTMGTIRWVADEFGVAGLGQRLFAHLQGRNPTKR